MAVTEPAGMYFMTPVWGESYTRLFLDVAIPCQLAPGNLPALRLPKRCQYLIFTTHQDAEVIVASSAYQSLLKHIPVAIKLIEDRPKRNYIQELQAQDKHVTMTMCYQRGIKLADDAGAASVFLTPDVAFSDGSFDTLQRLAAEGRRVVHMTGIRTIKQPVASTLRAKYMAGDVIAVDPRSLMRIALGHLHPLAHSSFWEEGDDLLPPNLYWRVGSEGIVARCFHLHPLFVLPERKHAVFYGTIDEDYVLAACPDSSMDFVCNDSDELFAVELSDLARYFRTGIPKGSVSAAAFWAEQGTNKRHRRLIDVPIRLKADKANDKLWIEAERKSDQVVLEIQSLLKQSYCRLMLAGKWAQLELRLSREARDRRVETANTSGGAAAALRCIDRKPVSIILAFRAALLGLILWPVQLYFGTMSKLSRAVRAVRELLIGPPWAPNVFSFSYLYVRQLSKHIVRTLTKIGLDVLVCSESKESIVSNIAFQQGAKNFGRLIDAEDLGRHGRRKILCNLNTGLPVLPECLGGILIDTVLRRSEDLEIIIHEAARVLKRGGWLALKIDRIANPASVCPSEALCTLEMLIQVLGPQFEIGDRRFQGGIGTTVALRLAYYRRLLFQRARIPSITAAALCVPLMPAEMIVAVILNVAGAILDRLDTSAQNYPSFILTAKKL